MPLEIDPVEQAAEPGLAGDVAREDARGAESVEAARVRGRPAAVMSQQSTELHGCLPNPWPLPEEVARAARHDLPLAPGYEPGDPPDPP